ncbi:MULTISPECIES: hypothetical protein [Janthinobacterium]|uniref:STAND family AAA ATPase n=1 Tax=Janthinobacterium TaxID=29580 RepID=UPI001C5B8EBF|nr:MULTISPECIES: hypothetical protein [Janthinobacterium]MBW3508326.1 hypothetical protein [Janthinobacterium sp. NKUCC06_STL]MCA1861247.1 hypothetical protein [Janthinobacterium lividum]
MKKFTALHIADVRLRRADEQEQAVMLHALYQDVAAILAAGKKIDAIFFTGQLVAPDACAGTTPVYVYEYFLRPLLQAASLPGARFYLVPGSRAQGVAAAALGNAGFSFFSADEHASAEHRAHYKNIHAVFHGNQHTGDASSLMKSLGILFKSNPGSLYSAQGQMAAFAVLEFGTGEAAADGGAAGTQWTVSLREFDDVSKHFALSVLYTPNGQETGQVDAEYVFATLLPQLAGERDYLDGLLGKAGAQQRVNAGVAADAREFLIELAFVMFEAKTVFLSEAELERFASDYCGVKGWSMAAGDWLAPLYAQGLLLRDDGQVAFSFDYFRTYFLAQRFETSFDLMRYGPDRYDGSESSLSLDGASAAQPFLRALGLSEEHPAAAVPEDCSRPG